MGVRSKNKGKPIKERDFPSRSAILKVARPIMIGFFSIRILFPVHVGCRR